jgi:predicted GIY-YIG superfamily endonuclease
MFCVYWIKSGSKHYIGATKDIENRLRQHNGEIGGGAWKTLLSPKEAKWKVVHIVPGFATWRDCLRFEYAFKHQTKIHLRIGHNKTQRVRALEATLSLPQWSHLAYV